MSHSSDQKMLQSEYYDKFAFQVLYGIIFKNICDFSAIKWGYVNEENKVFHVEVI